MNRHYSPRSVTIVITEIAWVVLTLGAALAMDMGWGTSFADVADLLPQITFATLLYAAALYYADLYNFSDVQIPRELLRAVVRAFTLLALIFGVLFLSTRWLRFDSITIFIHLVLTAAFVVFFRTRIDELLTHYGIFTRIAIVGAGTEAQGLAEEILRRPEHGQKVVCFVTRDGNPGNLWIHCLNPGSRAVPVISAGSLLEAARRQRIKRILVATADLAGDLPVDELLRCKADGFEVEDGHTFYERLLGRILTAQLRPEWLIFSGGFVRSRGALLVKRGVDVVAAIGLLVCTAPLSLLTALLIKLGDGGPVLFGQARAGRDGKPFTLWKFRSMRVGAEAETGPKWAEADDPRATRVGRYIRSLRIDEIPQGWNVLRGDMSFVGPRPERPEFVAQLRTSIPYYDHRHAMWPGITGWAQVNFPYAATAEDARQKLEYDLYYLKNFSILVDLLILARTVKIILFGWGSR